MGKYCKNCFYFARCYVTNTHDYAGYQEVIDNCGCASYLDKDLVLQLHCKPGDVVYVIEPEWNYENYGCPKYDSCYDSCDKCRKGYSKYKIEEYTYNLTDILHYWNYFGKTHFTSREDAEDELNRRKEKASKNGVSVDW